MSGGIAENVETSGNQLSMPECERNGLPLSVQREVLAGYNDLATTDKQVFRGNGIMNKIS